ncbi:hypothetical protein ACNDSU_26500, partial [Enterobacter hormaechei]
MGSCAAPSAKGDDKFITTDYLQQCHPSSFRPSNLRQACSSFTIFATEPTRVLSIVEIGADHF